MALSSLQLEAFYTCAQAGSFTLAAERLHITQSALSQRILNLEADLSVSLFIRERQHLKLTEFGEKLLRHCQTAESLESDLLRDLKSQNKIQGEIRIAGYSSVGTSIVLPRLTPLLKKYPELYFKYQDFELYELEAKLRSGEFRYIVSEQISSNPSLENIVIGKETYVLVEPKHNTTDFYLDHDEKDTTSQRLSGKAQIQRRYLGDAHGLIKGVSLGLGKAFLPEHLLDQKDKNLKIHKTIKTSNPIVLQFFKQSFYSKLHDEIVTAITQ